MPTLAHHAITKPKAYHHGDLRQALIASAHERVEQGGVGNVSLASIAKILGVSQAAPYRHFADRDALLAIVATDGFERFADELARATGAVVGKERLAALASAYVAFAQRHSGLYQLMFASHLLPKAANGDPLKRASHDTFRILSALLDDAGQPSDDGLSLHIWVALHGTAMLAINGLLEDNPSGVGLARLIQRIVAIG